METGRRTVYRGSRVPLLFLPSLGGPKYALSLWPLPTSGEKTLDHVSLGTRSQLFAGKRKAQRTPANAGNANSHTCGVVELDIKVDYLTRNRSHHAMVKPVLPEALVAWLSRTPRRPIRPAQLGSSAAPLPCAPRWLAALQHGLLHTTPFSIRKIPGRQAATFLQKLRGGLSVIPMPCGPPAMLQTCWCFAESTGAGGSAVVSATCLIVGWSIDGD